jgi:predicted nucleotide-binding protein
LKKRLEDVNRFEPRSVIDQFNAPELDALVVSIDDALVRTFGADTLDYERYQSAKYFERGPYNSMHPTKPAEFQRSIARSKDRTIALLGQAIRSLQERLEEHSAKPPVDQTSPEMPRLPTRKAFIVHGHDEGAREAVARFLVQIGFTPIILHEQPSQSGTVIEKIEAHGDVGFAVVILTPDDEGCEKGGTPKPRARQNVLLELGYFVGRLGRKHVCALKRGDLEIPSDFGGVVYGTYDVGGGWKQALGKELKAAGYEIDWNKVMQ